MIRHNPPVPTSGVEIEPYTGPASVQTYIGPRATVIEQVLEAFTQGRIRRYDPPTEIDNGHVLVIGYPTSAPEAQSPPSAGPRRWFADWPTYLLALGALVGVAIVAVLLFMVSLGLHALVIWSLNNALTIGIFALIGGMAALTFMGAVAKMRHGAGHYPQRY